MANIGAVIAVAEKLFQTLNSKWMTENKLEVRKLSKDISILKNVLLDADNMAQFSHEEVGWIVRLKDALYDADDLFDELRTRAEVKQQGGGKVDDLFPMTMLKLSKKVCHFREMFDGFVADLSRFGMFRVSRLTNISYRREETRSYINPADIIGRQEEVEVMVRKLMFEGKENDFFYSIVGIGGLGKTTLVQLVFNHKSVVSCNMLRLWVCVSDICGKRFDVNVILGKILESATGKSYIDGSTLESMQQELEKILKGRRYLLVLDDIWNEDYFEWRKLKDFLTMGGKGSRVVVTTRSMKTAKIIIGKSHENLYELNGLSDSDSWVLFKRIAFAGFEEETRSEFVEIGKRIVEKCSCVPLAIRVIGSLLYGQDIYKWRLLEERGFLRINGSENQVISILKLSYHNLRPSVKCCFSYCSLFPKNEVIRKELLICLWKAQGYIVPLHSGQSIEEAAEETFSIMLRMCFLRDVNLDESGNVNSFKLHNLMHDVAQDVEGKGICRANSVTRSLDHHVRHLFHAGDEFTESSFNKLKIRSCYIDLGIHLSLVDTLVENWRCLRSLCLSWSNSSDLPDSVGKLIHLRCLVLSENRDLRTLPDSIGKLYNLETLSLRGCFNLQVLPKTLTKLVKLEHLDIHGCDSLVCMPLGMDKLICLRVLTGFVVGDETLRKKQTFGRLDDLKTLVNVSGNLDIRMRSNSTTSYEMDRGVLEAMKHLNGVGIYFHPENDIQVSQALMEKLKPHCNLRKLNLSGYNGERIASWGSANDAFWSACLPNLVKVQLLNCEKLDYLPSLSELKHLKSLEVDNFHTLKYMDEIRSSRSFTFFPSLQSLKIRRMLQLKVWSLDSGLIFPRLVILTIDNCRKLTSIPPCPSLETLILRKINKDLRIKMIEDPSTSSSSSNDHPISAELDDLGYLDSLPCERLTSLSIVNQRRNPFNGDDVFKRCSSLSSLKIQSGARAHWASSHRGLVHLYPGSLKGLVHLTDPESLELDYDFLNSADDYNDLELDNLPLMQFLPHGMHHLTTLQHLSIRSCPNFQALPEWISRLSSLQSLCIHHCPALESLPEDVRNLTSLKQLEIRGCPRLTNSCQELHGCDWPKIQHIPQISIVES